jgi:hypothetical protein
MMSDSAGDETGIANGITSAGLLYSRRKNP